MFGFNSIAQSEMEDRLVLTVQVSASTFTWAENRVNNWDYEFYEISAPSNSGSGTVSGVGQSNPITFPSDGAYKLFIKPNTTQQFATRYDLQTPSERNKLISIDNWGNHQWYPISQYGFMRCDNLDVTAPDCPNLTILNGNGNFANFFAEDHSLKNSNGSIGNWDISQFTRIDSFFNQCNTLDSSINLGDWDVSKVTQMNSLFQACSFSGSLECKQITKNGKTYVAWNTSNVTNLNYTFGGNNTPTSSMWGGKIGNIDNWDTSAVTTMIGTFANNGTSYTRTSSFNRDISTKQVTVPGKGTYNAWDVSNVKYFGNYSFTNRYYNGCFHNSIFNQDISNWQINTGSGVEVDMQGMFGANPFFNQPITGSTVTVGGKTYEAWNTKKVKRFDYMFYNGNYNVFTGSFNQPIGNWDISSSVSLNYMFNRNQNFNQDLSKWNTSNVTSLTKTFSSCGITYDLSSSYQNHPTRGEYIAWDTSNVTSLYFTFENEVVGLIPLNGYNGDVTNWNTSNVTNLRGTFKGSNTRTSSFNQDISTKPVTIAAGTALEKTYNAWDVSNVTQFGYNAASEASYPPHRMGTFYNATSFNQPIGNWQINTGSNIEMQGLFRDTTAFNQPISRSMVTVGSKTYEAWNTKKVTRFRNMFLQASAFNQDIANWDVSGSTDNKLMFYYAKSFNQDISKWDVTNNTNWSSTFYGCPITFNLSSSYQPSTYGRAPYVAWDTKNVTNFSSMFFNYNGDNSNPNPGYNGDVTNWDTSNATNILRMFAGINATHTSSFNQDISTKQVTIPGKGTYNAWDVSNVTSFSHTNTTNTSYYRGPFVWNRVFNQDIGNWEINTGSAIQMNGMFYEATAFNQDISTKEVTVGSKTYTAWDTEKLAGTVGMFYKANSFNQPIGNWNLSNVTDMSYMFYLHQNFNQEISASVQTVRGKTYNAWYTPNNKNYIGTFRQSIFNKDVSNWNTSNVVSFSNMFLSSTNFNNGGQSLATQSVSLNGVNYNSWNFTSSKANFNNQFQNSNFSGIGLDTWTPQSASSFGYYWMSGAGLTQTTYDNILVSWAPKLNGVTLPSPIGFGTTYYSQAPSSAATAHATIEGYGISLTDGGPY
jgi:surface protein